ncbi:conserved hypothetical protein [Roseovarius sp. EC-HK134]|uniref:hypothetical protein n=1 Tax=unclassified Roseovarius TaxID=2614913 RepID=UPI001257EA02|nr:MULTISPECIES: hypothetical protein [unclassified Roseovarius]VVT19829.1 conserved hypothetical protein [Roseovarius sp. EC-SD190]VVT19960.1 conserved hypothetical protein [Roseovarius sp. EC-HK134]
MSEILGIRDQASLKEWLEDQPREVAVWIASRAAARVLPIWWEAVLSEDWANEANLTVLPALRRLLTSSVAFNKPSDSLKIAAKTTLEGGIVGIPFKPALEADGAARRAALAASAAPFAHNAALAVFTASRAHGEAQIGLRTDAEFVTRGEYLEALPLWPEGQGPLAERWRAIKWEVDNSEGAEDWRFWIEWYDTLLAGRPMLGDTARTWEMLELIALIDPETWDKGPEEVNPVIRGIWELHRLRAEVAALQAEKEAFLAVQASAAHRGHNQPPEGLVDDASAVAQQITIIWVGLDEAGEELDQVAPDKGVLRAIAERMFSALNEVVAYCGKVGDKVIMAGAATIGTTGGAVLIDHFAINGRLYQFVKNLLSFGIGG